MRTSPAVQRSSQAASCAASTARQPSARLRASASSAGGAGSSSRVSARATATRRSSSATWPATERQCHAQRSGKGRSGASGASASRSDAAPAIATPLPVPSVRHAPRSSSSCVGSIPKPAIAKLASSVTSTPSRSSANRMSCSPAAQSARDSRRSSRPVTVIPAGLRCVQLDKSTPRRRSRRRVPAFESMPMKTYLISPGSRMSLVGDELEHIGVLPGGLLAPTT